MPSGFLRSPLHYCKFSYSFCFNFNNKLLRQINNDDDDDERGKVYNDITESRRTCQEHLSNLTPTVGKF